MEKHPWNYNKNIKTSGMRFYTIWSKMKQRCLNTNDPEYKRYGGRGIKICNRWLKFDNFFKDMFNKYTKELSLDRINNNKGYCKKNCRWTTAKIQANNRRTNRIIKFNGEEKTLMQWSEYLGIKRTTITQRLDYYGWNIEKTLSTN